ncbi:MAG: metal-dependent hydrolase [Betaproteobacteria bacterium]|nr:MAG: metal-dependent hydrolase [Betaproteobacteria bacterium]
MRRIRTGEDILPIARIGIVAVALWLLASAAVAQQIEVLWLGHSAFRITSTTGKVIVIDPFLKRNPRTPAKYKELAALGKVDLILVTHGHQDHISDLPELANLTGATVVANYELANNLVGVGVLDATKTIVGMNKGGTLEPLGPGIKVHMVQAEHTSSVDMKRLKPEWTGPPFLDSGAAVGYVIEFENGFKIYHTGDTDVFGDMGLIGRFFKPDLVLICIGGHFTMDPEHAAFALRELIRPKQVIPMHYGTFPVINRTPAELKAALGNAPIKMLDVKPGEAVRF